MTDQIRDLLISLSSHMAYMQGQLEARHELYDPEDYYWYRESATLRQKVTDLLASEADGPAVPEGREPASVNGQPSDEEIMGLMPQQMHEDLAYAARAMANEAGTDSRKAKGFMRIALNRHVVDLARAVLARWATPNLAEIRRSLGDAPQPVPVSERLPGAEDCDADGFCWWFSPADPSAGTFGVAACWVLRKPEPEDDFRTHWLPAHALPIPEQGDH